MLAAFLLAQATVPTVNAASSDHCLMVNPVGDRLTFSITEVEGDAFRIAAHPGSGWPRRPIAVSAVPESSIGEGAATVYIVGFGTGSRHLVVDSSGKATMFALNDGAHALPLAVGFCSDAPTASRDLPSVSTSGDPFAPSIWRNGCTLVARNGVSAAIGYVRLGPDAVEISDASRTVWSRPFYRLRVLESHAARPRFRASRADTAPSGTEEFFILGTFASKLIEFESLGPDSLIDQQTTVAICGHTGVSMRATRQ
jgi:hypothetical protein